MPKLIAGCLLLAASECPAQTSPTEVARRELLQGADAARAAGDHPRALDLARRAGEIRMTPSVRLLLAQESEVTGSLLEALDHASGCVREAEADATLRNRATILSNCRALESALRPRLGSVVLQVSAPPAGAVIRVAGHEIPAALFGLPVRVMPGSVVVEVGGEGIEASRQEVQVAAGESVDVPVQVRAVERPISSGEASPTTGQTVQLAASVATTTVQVPTTVLPTSNASSGPGAAPWALVGIGGAAIVGGGVLLLMGAIAHDDRDNVCTSRLPECEAAYNTAGSRFATLTNAGWWTLGAGGAILASGIIWQALAGSRGGARVTALSVTPANDGFSIGIGGRL